MSEPLQSRRYPGGEHPDADQLSAFVEQALSEHERLETLAHLAECANCREVVALSLPPLEDAATLEPVPVIPPSATPESSWWFSSLFSGWRLVWIAGPALAALVILTVSLRKFADSQRQAPPPGQVADSHSQLTPPPSAVKPDAAPAPLALKAARHPANAERSEQSGKPKAASKASSAGVSAIDDGRNLAVSKQPSPIAAEGRVADSTDASAKANQIVGGAVPLRGSMAGIGLAGGVGLGTSSAPSQGGMALNFVPSPSQPAPVASMAPARVGGQADPDQPLAPAVMKQASVAAANSTTIAVSGQNAQMDITVETVRNEAILGGSLVASSPAQSKSTYVPAQVALPSGLAVLSLAVNLHKRLVLDTHNQLFFSADDGQHWKIVSVPWRARATKVVALTGEGTGAKAFPLAVPERYTPGATATAQPAALSEAKAGEIVGRLTGAVTDWTGAVISGATVIATDSHTAFTRRVQTDSGGRYLVEELPPGVYHIDVRAPGFMRQTQTAVLAPPQQAVANIVLAIGQTAQSVTVQASPSAPLPTFSRAMPLASAKARKAAAPAPADKLAPVFVITTDTGERWTSADGHSWKHE